MAEWGLAFLKILVGLQYSERPEVFDFKQENELRVYKGHGKFSVGRGSRIAAGRRCRLLRFAERGRCWIESQRCLERRRPARSR